MDDSVQASVKYRFDFFKLLILGIFTVYFFGVALNPSEWHFLDNVILLIHEAGHFIFGIFGNEFLTVAGGSIMQLLMPLAFVINFYMTGQKFSASLTMFWLGQSILNVSVYMADAVLMQLPLLGGDGVIHDWNYLFGRLGLLSLAFTVAAVVRGLGLLIIAEAIISGFINSRGVETAFKN